MRRSLIGVAALLLLMLFVCIGLLFAGPQAIPFAESRLESTVASMAAPYTVKGERLLGGLVIDHGLMLDMAWSNAVIRDGSGQEVARLPEVSARLPFVPLLFGSAHLRAVHVRGAELLLAKGEGGWQLGLKGRETPGKAEWSSLVAMSERVGKIEFDDGVVYLQAGGREGRLLVRNARFKVGPRKISLDAVVAADEVNGLTDTLHVGLVPSDAGWDGRGSLVVRNMARYAPLLGPLGGYAGGVSGEAALKFGKNGLLARFDASVHDNGAATYHDPSFLPSPIPVDRVALTVSAHGEPGGLIADRIDARLASGPLQVSAKGNLRLASEITGQIDLEGSGLPVAKLKDYWPLALAPLARQWVVEHVTGGAAGRSTCRILLQPGDLTGRYLPPHAIEAVVPISGVSLTYLPNMPPLTDIEGRLHLTGRNLELTATKAASFEASTGSGTVVLPDFNDPSLPIAIRLDVAAPARDVADAMSKQRLDLAPELALDAGKISGQVQGTLDLFVTAYPRDAGPAESGEPILDYAIDGTLEGVGQKGLLGKWNVEGMTGTVSVRPDEIALSADTKLQEVPGHLEVRQETVAARGEYRWKALMPIERFADFGIDLPDGSSGEVALDAKIVEEGGATGVEAKADLKATAIDFAALGYVKPRGKPASLDLKYTKAKDGAAAVPSFRFASENDGIAGSLSFASDGSLREARVPEARFNGSRGSLDFRTNGVRRRVSITGSRIDVSPWWNRKSGGGDDRFAELHDLDLDVSIRQLIVSGKSDLRKVSGTLSCNADCEKASFDAYSEGDRPISYRLSRIDGQRRLAVQAADFGELLKAFGYSEHVHGGELTLQGRFADEKKNHPLEARLMVEHFHLQNMPTLTRMLTLASLTGLGDAVSGRGIGFRRLSGDVVYTDGDIVLKEMRAVGSALGVLFDGALDHSGRIDLNGTLVPSYAANSLIGKIPLIGTAIVGGEGQGLIGARFSVDGTLDKPDVAVNPLSVLTPGFLRNIFGLADDAPEEAAKKIQSKPDTGNDKREELPPAPPK